MNKKITIYIVITHLSLAAAYLIATLPKDASNAYQKKIVDTAAVIKKKSTKPTMILTHRGPVRAIPISGLAKNNKGTSPKATVIAQTEQLELFRQLMSSRAKQYIETGKRIPGPSTPNGSATAAGSAPSSAATTPFGSPKWTTAQGKPKNASPNTGSPSLLAELQNSQSKPSTPRHSPRQNTSHN